MPQITQLSMVFASQFFWLVVVFGLIFFVIGLGMLPKVRSTVAKRDSKVAEDLEKARAAQASAEEAEAAWRARMDQTRLEASTIAQEARRAAARENEAMVNAALEKINLRVEAAQQNIRKAAADIRVEMMDVAAEATQDLVKRLTGVEIARQEALDAVTAELELMAGQSPAQSPRIDQRRVAEKVS
jgi:F-type H+-transporting ATPase subunit b